MDPDADEEDYEPGQYDPCEDNAEVCEEDDNVKRGIYERARPGLRRVNKFSAQLATDLILKIPFPPYPSKFNALFTDRNGGLKTLPFQGGIKMADTVCAGAAITYVAAENIRRKVESYTGKAKNMLWNTEHLAEVCC